MMGCVLECCCRSHNSPPAELGGGWVLAENVLRTIKNVSLAIRRMRVTRVLAIPGLKRPRGNRLGPFPDWTAQSGAPDNLPPTMRFRSHAVPRVSEGQYGVRLDQPFGHTASSMKIGWKVGWLKSRGLLKSGARRRYCWCRYRLDLLISPSERSRTV